MSQFRRILLPLNGNSKAVEYAMDMAKQSNAKLFFLKTYRLIEEMQRMHASDKSLKLSIDEEFENDFENKYGALLKSSKLEYELLVEVGFISDRILANIKEKKIDMLLIDGLNRWNDDNLIDRFSELNVPVLLIPESSKDTSAA